MQVEVGGVYVDVSKNVLFKVVEIFVTLNEKGKAQALAKVEQAVLNGGSGNSTIELDTRLLNNLKYVS